MRLDLSSGQPLRIQRNDRVVETLDPASVFGHDLRRERALPVPGHINAHLTHIGPHRFRRRSIPLVRPELPDPITFLVAEMLIQLGIQRRFQHRLRQLSQQPVRPDQRHPIRPGLIDQLPRNPHIEIIPDRGRARGRGGHPVLACQP